MENFRSFARATAGRGWLDLDWGSDGPPQDNTDIAWCQETTAATWQDFMRENQPASGGGWRIPACRVNAAGEFVTLPSRDSKAVGNVRQHGRQYSVFSRSNVCNLVTVLENAKKHFWINKSTIRTNANKLINCRSTSDDREGCFNLQFLCLDGSKWECGLTRYKDGFDVNHEQIVHVWIRGSANASVSSRQKAVCLALNLADFLCVFLGTGLMAYPGGPHLSRAISSRDTFPPLNVAAQMDVAAPWIRWVVRLAKASIPNQRSASGAAALSSEADESIPNQRSLSGAAALSGEARITVDDNPETVSDALSSHSSSHPWHGAPEGTDPVHDTDINAQNWACNQVPPPWTVECIVVPPDIRGAASGDASASGDDSAAEALQDDFDSAEEPPVDAQWISPDVALDEFFAELPTHENAEEVNCKHARIFKQVVSTWLANDAKRTRMV
jgi:hypothetical protein